MHLEVSKCDYYLSGGRSYRGKRIKGRSGRNFSNVDDINAPLKSLPLRQSTTLSDGDVATVMAKLTLRRYVGTHVQKRW